MAAKFEFEGPSTPSLLRVIGFYHNASTIRVTNVPGNTPRMRTVAAGNDTVIRCNKSDVEPLRGCVVECEVHDRRIVAGDRDGEPMALALGTGRDEYGLLSVWWD